MNARDRKYLIGELVSDQLAFVPILCREPGGVATAKSGSVFNKRGSKGGSTIVIATSAVVIWNSDGKTV